MKIQTMKCLVAALFVNVFALGDAQAMDKNYSLTLSEPNEPARLEVELHYGELKVIGYDGKTIEISAKVTEPKSEPNNKHKAKIKARMKEAMGRHRTEPRSSEGLKSVKNQSVNLEIEENNNSVEIASMAMNQYVQLTLMVPYNTSVESEVFQGGGIEVSDIRGELELQAYQGGVYAKNVSGPIVAETQMDDVVIELSEFNSSTPTSLTSHLGNIDITIDSSVSANINVQTFQGEIFSGLDTEFVAVDQVNKNDKKRKQKIVLGGTMQAKVNGGGQDLSLSTYMGNLYIRKAN